MTASQGSAARAANFSCSSLSRLAGVAALIVSLCVHVTPAGAQVPGGPPGRADGLQTALDLGKLDASRFSRLSERLSRQGRVRLILQLDAPDKPFARLTGRKARSAQSRSLRRAQVRDLQNRLLSRPGLNATVSAVRFAEIPYIALSATAAQLDRIARAPEVTEIHEDTPLRPLLDVSVPQIGADLAWSSGSEPDRARD